MKTTSNTPSAASQLVSKSVSMSAVVFTLLVMFTTTTISFAQTSNSQFLDRNRDEQASSVDAFYIRTNEVDDANIYHVKINTISSGVLIMTGSYSDQSLTTEEGLFQYYFANGNLESEGQFNEGTKTGDWKRWEVSGISKPNRFYPVSVPAY